MTFDEFNEEVNKRAAMRYPDMDVSIREVLKNNGTILHGFSMSPKDGGFSISPTIYMEDFFSKVQDGMDISDAIERIFSTFDSHIDKSQDIKFTGELLTDPDYVRTHVFMTLVNKEKNAELLADAPHKDFYDLSVEYRIRVNIGDESEGVGSILIKNNILDMSGVKADELHDLAMKNTRANFGVTVRTMRDVMVSMMGEDAAMFLPPEDEMLPMYIISNDNNINGAVNILYDDALAQISERVGGDLVVLPSSVHEVICVPVDVSSVEDLTAMVQSVNAGQVAPEEQLSDNVYMYDAEEHLLSDAATYEQNHQEDESFVRPRHR